MQDKSEDRIQQEIIIWFNNKYCLEMHPNRSIIFHVPNERINERERMRLASIGVLPGVSDLVVVHKGVLYWIEVKTPSGTQKENQKEFEQRVTDQGFTYKIVRSLEEFKDFINTFV